MNDNDYRTTITVDQTPDEVFAAITNVRGWWSGQIEGNTADVGEQFTYRYQDIHRSTQKITTAIPGQRIVWHVVDSYLDHASDEGEWTGTDITFDLTRIGDQTQVHFTHVGLAPDVECYDSCSSAWAYYVNTSLRNLITTGTGQPNTAQVTGDAR